MTKLIFITNIFFWLVLQGNAQSKIVQVNGAKGMAYIIGDESPSSAKRKALEAAKTEALRLAGAKENITITQTLNTIETQTNFEQYFSEHSLIELNGVINQYEVVSEKMTVKDSMIIEYKVTIKAEVLFDASEKDLDFVADIFGIKTVYGNGAKLTFGLSCALNSYLYIFYREGGILQLLSPNVYEANLVIDKDSVYTFPKGNVDYVLTAEKDAQHNLIFVFSKEKRMVPQSFYNHQLDENIFFNWVYGIPKSERLVRSYNFWVVK